MLILILSMGIFEYSPTVQFLPGGQPIDILNLRNREEREKWRNDTACTDSEAAGDMLLPTKYGGTPEIDDGVYEAVKQKWLKRSK